MPVALVGLVLVGCGIGLLYPVSLAGAMATSPGLEAQGSTRSALASGLAIGSGPLAFGALADISGTANASWVVVAMLAAGIAATFVSRRGGTADLAAVGRGRPGRVRGLDLGTASAVRWTRGLDVWGDHAGGPVGGARLRVTRRWVSALER